MKIFLIVTATILAAIIGLTLISIGFLLNQNARKKVRFTIFFIDIFLITVCLIGFNNRNLFSNTIIEIFGDIMTIIFMSQIICAGLVLIAVLIRRIYNQYYESCRGPEKVLFTFIFLKGEMTHDANQTDPSGISWSTAFVLAFPQRIQTACHAD